MLSISVFDLFQESAEAVGKGWANVWFFAGVCFFAAVVHFIPEPDSASLVIDDDDDDDGGRHAAKGGGEAAVSNNNADSDPPATPHRSSARLRWEVGGGRLAIQTLILA